MMQISMYEWILIRSCVLITVMFLAWRLWNWAWLSPKTKERCLRQQGLKGTSYKPPFGDLKEMIAMTKEAKSRPIGVFDDIVPRVIPFYDKAINIHGKNCFTWLGPIPVFHVLDPDLIRDTLTRIKNFQKPTGGSPLLRMLTKGLAHTEGEQWMKHRRIINPAFHVEKLKHMVPVFSLCCSEMIDKWEQMLHQGGGACEFDVVPDIQILTRDVISRTAFGSSYEEGKKIFKLQKEQAELMMQVISSFYVRGMEFLPTKRNKRLKEIYKQVNISIGSIIKTRLKAMEEGQACNDDLLGILLESNNREIQEKEDEESGLSIEEVIEECKLFYGAGQGTVSNLLIWTLVLLSQHSSWQEQARNEVFQVFGKGNPDIDGLNRLKIVTMIIQEVMRLYPAVATQPRMVHEETKVGGLTLPANTMICIHTLRVQHDKEIWGADAKEFKPERFAEGMSNATKGQLSYLPFSWGPRVCIGQNFSMMEAKIVLSMLLQRFFFKLSPSYSHAPHVIISIEPQHGAHLILQKI